MKSYKKQKKNVRFRDDRLKNCNEFSKTKGLVKELPGKVEVSVIETDLT